MTRVALVGKTSFMAKAMQEYGIGEDWLWLSHGEALEDKIWLGQVDCIVNFAYAPALRKEAYTEENDVDLKLAKIIRAHNIHYIMLSSRMVYGHPYDAEELRENMVPAPENIYGQNKRRIEENLVKTLGDDRVTRLRLSNIFGFEPDRASFFGMALTRLAREGKIVYDMNPFVRRDFLSVWRFGQALEKICARPFGGVYNLGAGFGVETGLIAEWLIEGYGSGALLIENMQRRDIFWLDMSRTNAQFDLQKLGQQDIRQDCVMCGQQMKERYA